MDVDKLYPYVKKGSRLVLEPVGGLLKLASDGANFKKEPKLELNALAVEIVKRCNGQQTCHDIIYEMAHCIRTDDFDVSDAVAEFLADLGRRGLVRFSDTPLECAITIVGSTEHFTPLHFAIELTDHCNLFCRHCYRSSGLQLKNFLPTSKLLSLLETMEYQGVNSVELTGGEPTTHPEFISIFEKASELFSRVGVISNGTLIDGNIIDAFSKGGEKIVVQIDLDGDSAEVHDSLRGIPGSFDRVRAAAQRMKYHNVKFRAVMNVYPGNLSRVRQTAILARNLGARQFSFASVLPIGRAIGMQRFSQTELLELVKLVNELEEAYPDFIQVSIKEQEGLFFHQKGNCGAGSRSLVLGPTGNVRPCPMLSEENGIFGNLLEENYQTVIQRAPLSEHYHLQMPDEATCQSCNYLYFCKGCFTRPFHACADAEHHQESLVCVWNEKTRYFDLMKRFQLWQK